jgi:predicted nucleic acid-binding protein
MARLVLSDASPLIALSRVNGLAWLPSLFGTVSMPPEVYSEVLPGLGLPGEDAITQAMNAGWLDVTGPPPGTPALPELDEGESACIRVALAHDGPALLLIDERAGRTIAQERGLRVAGTAAVIGLAKQRGLNPIGKRSLLPCCMPRSSASPPR